MELIYTLKLPPPSFSIPAPTPPVGQLNVQYSLPPPLHLFSSTSFTLLHLLPIHVDPHPPRFTLRPTNHLPHLSHRLRRLGSNRRTAPRRPRRTPRCSSSPTPLTLSTTSSPLALTSRSTSSPLSLSLSLTLLSVVWLLTSV